MDQTRVFLLIPTIILLLFQVASSEDKQVNDALVEFMEKLSAGISHTEQNFGWNTSSDPCIDKWVGVTCDSQFHVRKIVLNQMNLTGFLDVALVCKVKTLFVLSLQENNISGAIPEDLGNCKRLTHLYLTSNNFSGPLPESLSELSNLKRIAIANNHFSGEIPKMSSVSGLLTFLAQNNQLSGEIPEFYFSSLVEFNVSNNNFNGPIPDVKGRFGADSFSGNPDLCGKPLSNLCPSSSATSNEKSSKNRIVMYLGYVILALAVGFFIILKLVVTFKRKSKQNKPTPFRKSGNKPRSSSSESRSMYSTTYSETERGSSSLVVFSSPMLKGLRFEDLLQSPAELLGRGKRGSLYKVIVDNGMYLAVKRIKNWNIPENDFKNRMQRLHQVKHPKVFPIVAFYCSKQEKLLVYEYQPNGSLFKLLLGCQNGQTFEWRSRLNVAASIAEALAFTHEAFREHGIAHGNLKSTNILFNNDMDPCISEYGLMSDEQSSVEQCNNDSITSNNVISDFKADIYALGLIFLELLTGRAVQNNRSDLARWVYSVVEQEWTAEVFDKALILEGASEERMVHLLQIALKCVNPSPNERPSINQVATMINVIKEEEERSSSLST
ncbi:hypothetical protein ACFE04_028854 [Oxalis oulophora]